MYYGGGRVIICNGILYMQSFQGDLRLLDIKNDSINACKNVEINRKKYFCLKRGSFYILILQAMPLKWDVYIFNDNLDIMVSCKMQLTSTTFIIANFQLSALWQ